MISQSFDRFGNEPPICYTDYLPMEFIQNG